MLLECFNVLNESESAKLNFDLFKEQIIGIGISKISKIFFAGYFLLQECRLFVDINYNTNYLFQV